MELKIGDKVNIQIIRDSGIGFAVMVNNEFEGMIYKNELYEIVEESQKLVGYIKKIREDGKLDISIQPLGFKRNIVKNEIIILNALKQKSGSLSLHDKSDPKEIKLQLGMSKKAFKSALGGLFRQKLITISEDKIELINHK